MRIANDSPTACPAQSSRTIRAGTLSINKGVYFGADAPFGGYKQSGIGREMGAEGFDEFLQTKTIATEVEPD